MQKLLTSYLDSASFKTEGIFSSNADLHGNPEEHLTEYLSDGWSIRSVSSFGGAAESTWVRGWVVVLLEKTS